MYFPSPKIKKKRLKGGGNKIRPYRWGRNHTTVESDSDNSAILDSDSDVDVIHTNEMIESDHNHDDDPDDHVDPDDHDDHVDTEDHDDPVDHFDPDDHVDHEDHDKNWDPNGMISMEIPPSGDSSRRSLHRLLRLRL